MPKLTCTYPKYLSLRLSPVERKAVERLQDAYGLPSLSEAARRAIRQQAQERGLIPAGEVRDG